MEAKLCFIEREQGAHFPVEINFLANSNASEVPLLVKSLNLFMGDNQIIRCKRRLEKSSFNYDVRNPILLPRHSSLTELLVWDAHQHCKHIDKATTLNFIHTGHFWITKDRGTVKSILNKCITCKKINVHAFKYSKHTNFIIDRVNFCTPYQHVGIDYTGHVYVKFHGDLHKMYIIFFTCLNIRSIHLETIPFMSCKNFLLAFIRFCNSHTIPDVIYSDNASTFINTLGILNGSLIVKFKLKSLFTRKGTATLIPSSTSIDKQSSANDFTSESINALI